MLIMQLVMITRFVRLYVNFIWWVKSQLIFTSNPTHSFHLRSWKRRKLSVRHNAALKQQIGSLKIVTVNKLRMRLKHCSMPWQRKHHPFQLSTSKEVMSDGGGQSTRLYSDSGYNGQRNHAKPPRVLWLSGIAHYGWHPDGIVATGAQKGPRRVFIE